MIAYYNEIEPYAAQWLRNLIAKGLIANGEVDTRSIVDVAHDDLKRFTQCHFFAGIGGWSHAFRLAGWPDDRPIWTGSCPCQPFSVAGKGAGTDDPRHLWPHFFRLIHVVRPPVVMGEQVAGAAGYGWLDGVRSDLEAEGYASRGVDIPACAVDAPHIRQRLYWVAADLGDTDMPHGERRRVSSGVHAQFADINGGSAHSHMADAPNLRCDQWEHARNMVRPARKESKHEPVWDADSIARGGSSSFWDHHIWLTGADGKARRAQPGIPLLAHGIPNRVGRLRAYGNAIVPQVAAEVIKAFMEAQP